MRTEYGEVLRISPYSVQMRENVDQNNSEYGHFLRSDVLKQSPRPVSINSKKLVFLIYEQPE